MGFWVYEHKNKINGKRYIGITMQKPEVRWKRGSTYKGNQYFYRAIEKYGWDGFEHNILEDNLTKEEALEAERKYIAQFKSAEREYGYNIGLGGEGQFSFSEHTREAMRQAGIKRAKRPGEKERRTEAGKRQFATEEAREKDRQAQIQYNMEHPEKRLILAKPVNQYTLDGRFIKRWDCIADIRKEYGSFNASVPQATKRGRKTSHGYMWRFAEGDDVSDIEPYVPSYTHTKEVCQFTLDGDLIKIWKSTKEAAEAINKRSGNIISCCINQRNNAYGYKWKYREDYESGKKAEILLDDCRE
jgi:group I intron endonuclease